MSKGTKLRNIRASDDIWLPAKIRAEREGTNLTAVIVQFLTEYAGSRSDLPSDAHPHDQPADVLGDLRYDGVA